MTAPFILFPGRMAGMPGFVLIHDSLSLTRKAKSKYAYHLYTIFRFLEPSDGSLTPGATPRH